MSNLAELANLEGFTPPPVDSFRMWRKNTRSLPDGPWTQEPDKAQWVDPGTGLDCLVLRAMNGALCGYVGVPSDHPWHGLSECALGVDVHGGLSYSGLCAENKDYICHQPGPGRPDDVWWLGFACVDWYDVIPAFQGVIPGSVYEYRDFGFVADEIKRLAEQVAAA